MSLSGNEMSRSAGAAAWAPRAGAAAAALILAGVLACAGATAAFAARHRAPRGHPASQGHHARRAQATHTLRASDRAKLRYRSAKGSTLYETGQALGSLPGAMRVHMRVTATFTGTFTIYAHGGTITGHGRALPHGSGTIESFKGTLTVTSGSGRYRHARGRARLYGTFNRRTYALTIQTAGTLRY